ncbi:MAG: hypothetical protein KBF93_09590 [Leptospiraceae bacterium]|nr:hypothetical protein [Leptospiraceae bacterium]
MNVRINQSNNKKLQLIERIISIENNEVIETLWTLLHTAKKVKPIAKEKQSQFSMNGKELKKTIRKWEKSKNLTEQEFFQKLDKLI